MCMLSSPICCHLPYDPEDLVLGLQFSAFIIGIKLVWPDTGPTLGDVKG